MHKIEYEQGQTIHAQSGEESISVNEAPFRSTCFFYTRLFQYYTSFLTAHKAGNVLLLLGQQDLLESHIFQPPADTGCQSILGSKRGYLRK